MSRWLCRLAGGDSLNPAVQFLSFTLQPVTFNLLALTIEGSCWKREVTHADCDAGTRERSADRASD